MNKRHEQHRSFPEEVWGRWIREILSEIDGPPGFMVDVGANIGKYSIEFARKAARVIAIEPEVVNAAALKRVAGEHGLDNITIVPKAVWRDRNRLPLYFSKVDRAGHSIVWGGHAHVNVDADSLDALLAEQGVGDATIELLKVNVEGSELEVLYGAESTLPRVKRIILEAHYRPFPSGREVRAAQAKTTEEVKQILEARGFTVRTRILEGFDRDIVYGEKGE